MQLVSQSIHLKPKNIIISFIDLPLPCLCLASDLPSVRIDWTQICCYLFETDVHIFTTVGGI